MDSGLGCVLVPDAEGLFDLLGSNGVNSKEGLLVAMVS